MRTVLRPVDAVLVAFNLVMIGVWTPLAGTTPLGGLFAGIHLVAAALVLVVARRPGPENRWADTIRESYPLSAIVLVWSEIGLLHRLQSPAGHDGLISALDLRLFGAHWHALWMAAMPQTGFAELQFALYLAYYPLVFGLPILFAVFRCRNAFRDAVFRFVLVYLACDLCYLMFPVYGPRFAGGLPPETATVLGSFAESLRASGDSPGTAFPSSHVAGVVTAALLAWRFFPRRLAWVWVAGAVGVTLSTIYTRNHYTTDALAGVALAVALWIWVAPAVERAVHPKRSRPFRPCFPRLAPDAIPGRAGRPRRNLP